MSSKKTVKSDKVQSSAPHPWIPDQSDGHISWMRAEFAAASAIIGTLCDYLRSMGGPGEYDSVIGCVQQRQVSWKHVLRMQPFFPVTDIVHALQYVAWRRQQRVVGGGKEFGSPVVLNFGSGLVQRDEATGGSPSVDGQNLNAIKNLEANVENNRVGKEREEKLGHGVRKSNDIGLVVVPNATGDSLNTQVGDSLIKTSRNPAGANNPYTESHLKDVKVEIILISEGSRDSLVAKNDLAVQNKNEESLAISPNTFHVVGTSDGKKVNVADRTENLKHISPINDRRAAGKHRQFAGDELYDGDYEANNPPPGFRKRIKWHPDEDRHLIKAWLNTDREIVATHEKPKPFWSRIAVYYREGKLEKWVGRRPTQCKARWSIINRDVLKFVGCYEEACKQKTGEQSEDDVVRNAHKLYYNEIGKTFSLQHAMYALQSESKWRDFYLKVTTNNTTEDSGDSAKRMKANSSSSSSKASLSASSNGARSHKRKGKRVERDGSDDDDDSGESLQCISMKEEELEMKLKVQREYLLAKKYQLLGKLVAQSGSLTSSDMMFKNKLMEDLLKQ